MDICYPLIKIQGLWYSWIYVGLLLWSEWVRQKRWNKFFLESCFWNPVIRLWRRKMTGKGHLYTILWQPPVKSNQQLTSMLRLESGWNLQWSCRLSLSLTWDRKHSRAEISYLYCAFYKFLIHRIYEHNKIILILQSCSVVYVIQSSLIVTTSNYSILEILQTGSFSIVKILECVRKELPFWPNFRNIPGKSWPCPTFNYKISLFQFYWIFSFELSNYPWKDLLTSSK